jgi:hypothetical protein
MRDLSQKLSENAELRQYCPILELILRKVINGIFHVRRILLEYNMEDFY